MKSKASVWEKITDEKTASLIGVNPATKIAEMKKIVGSNLHSPQKTLLLLLPYLLSETQQDSDQQSEAIIVIQKWCVIEDVEKVSAETVTDSSESLDKLIFAVGVQIDRLSGVDPAIKMAEMVKIANSGLLHPLTILIAIMSYILSKP